MPWLVVTSHRTVTNVRLTDLLSIGRVPCNNKCGSPQHGANCTGLSKVRRHQRLLNTVFQSRLNYYASASKTSRRAPVPCGTDRDVHHISVSGSEHTRHPPAAPVGALERFRGATTHSRPVRAQKRHKLLRLLAAKSTTEQMGKIVLNPALRNFGAGHSTHVGGCRQFSRC